MRRLFWISMAAAVAFDLSVIASVRLGYAPELALTAKQVLGCQ